MNRFSVCPTCKIYLVREAGFLCCTGCGLSSFSLGDPTLSFGSSNSILSKSVFYDRRYRFHTHICRLGRRLFNAPQITDPIWKVLEKSKPTTIKNLLSTLRHSNEIVNKHYSQLSVFSQVFLKDDIESMTSGEYTFCMKLFDVIHEAWKNDGMKTFFSYNFLIELFCVNTALERFIAVLKPLKCCKRRKKYSDKLESLLRGDFWKIKTEIFESHVR